MKLVVQFSNGKYINIEADYIEREDSFISAYKFKEPQLRLVAVIDLGMIDYLYLSEVKG